MRCVWLVHVCAAWAHPTFVHFLVPVGYVSARVCLCACSLALCVCGCASVLCISSVCLLFLSCLPAYQVNRDTKVIRNVTAEVDLQLYLAELTCPQSAEAQPHRVQRALESIRNLRLDGLGHGGGGGVSFSASMPVRRPSKQKEEAASPKRIWRLAGAQDKRQPLTDKIADVATRGMATYCANAAGGPDAGTATLFIPVIDNNFKACAVLVCGDSLLSERCVLPSHLSPYTRTAQWCILYAHMLAHVLLYA